MQIEFEETPSKGRYYVPSENAKQDVAELTFSKAGKDTIIADHTGVPDRFRGQGVGLALLNRLIADARAKGVKVVPQCPFVRAMYKKHPEWSDVMRDD